MGMENFWSHRKFFWMWTNLLGLALFSLLYIFHSPMGGHSGDTFYGYSLGVLATAGIVYLMWYGIRKRSYQAVKTTLKGWLAAHVWLGISLLLIVPLHAGFSFGWNVHSLAYILMVVVIVSGIWGALNYQNLASKIRSNRGGGHLANLVEQLHLYGANIEKICVSKSDAFLNLRDRMSFSLRQALWKILVQPFPPGLRETEITRLVSNLAEAEREDAVKLVTLCEKKRQLGLRVQEEVRVAAKLKLWLLIHLPVSIGLLVMVIIHIYTVFYYR